MQTQKGQTITPISSRLLPRLALSCLKNHKEGYPQIPNSTTNPESQDYPLPISKDAAPHLEVDEINRLAKAWCELMIEHRQVKSNRAITVIPGEN